MLAFAPLYAMAASIEMMLEIGPGASSSRVMELAAKTCRLREPRAAEVLHCESPIITARFDTGHGGLACALGAAGLSLRRGTATACLAALLQQRGRIEERLGHAP